MISADYSVRNKWAAVLYWIGVALTATCILLILMGQTERLYRLEHSGFPLSWAFGGLAILAFGLAEQWMPAHDDPETDSAVLHSFAETSFAD
jgi:hypothetical protein